MTDLKRSKVKVKHIKYLRDLGGIYASDGRKVKEGLIYRSSDLTKINEKSSKKLFDDMNVRNVIDLRSHSEKEAMPEIVPSRVDYYDYPTLSDFDNPAVTRKTRLGILKRTMNGEGGAIGHLSRNYRKLISSEDAINYYKKIFSILLSDDDKAVLYHCTQGKDRTGVVSILILLSLGVEMDKIERDYFYFNKTRRFKNAMIYVLILIFLFSKKKAHALYCFLTTRKEYLEAVFDEIKTKFGGIKEYIHDVLELSEEDLLKLRNKYLV